ncbi:MAG: arsenate reductase (azurin) large subunit [Thermoplasmata archaeon]
MAAGSTSYVSRQSVPLPPPTAKISAIACEYCPVACGYKVYTWPVGTEGGPRSFENALGVDYPTEALSGKWISPNMYNQISIGGRQHHVVIIPDGDAQAVNLGGTHSVRGGSIAQKVYNPASPTADRLTTPMLRVGGTLTPISWDLATDLVAELSQYVVQNHGELAWGMKRYSYQFFENTYAITKLAFGAIGSPNHAPHHAPALGSDTPGLSDAGMDPFPSSFEDFKEADVVMVSGSDPYETKTVLFTTWIAVGGAKIVYVDPRKTFTANYAERGGGLHLQIKPGTDTALYNAIARVIIENGWTDQAFISAYTASRAELDQETKWRRQLMGMTFDELRAYLTGDPRFTPEGAEAITGVPADKIRRAAEVIAKPVNGQRPRVVFSFEKGLYWTHNHENTASYANLALLTGSTGELGRALTRFGGHQRGNANAAPYPLDKSPHDYQGNKIEMDTDRWTVEGNTRLMWVIGTNWVGAMAGSQFLKDRLRELVLSGPQVTSLDKAAILQTLQARVDAGGMILVFQDIYLNDTSEFADIVLPAATWGEEDFTRANLERRLRLYQKFMDAPGEARPDWQIVAEVARKMGHSGFDWPDSNSIFEESGAVQVGKRMDYKALVDEAQARGMRAHDLLGSFGTTGLQLPVRRENGGLVETPRLHTDKRFNTASGKANFVKGDWDAVEARNAVYAPQGEELWVLNGRVNVYWNNLFDFMRRPYTFQRFPMNFLEINEADASQRGIESGDLVNVTNPAVRNHLGGNSVGYFTAVAYVTDQVPPGATFAYFHFPGSHANSVVPADTTLQPLNLRYSYKLGKGRVAKLGTSHLKDTMSFVPRNIV